MDILSKDLHAMRKLLRKDSDCTDWLAGTVGKGKFRREMGRIDNWFKIADSIVDPNKTGPDGKPLVILGTTFDFPEWLGVVINYGYYHDDTASGKMQTLLHELAHYFHAKGFLDFGEDASAQDANQALLLEHCSNTIGAN